VEVTTKIFFFVAGLFKLQVGLQLCYFFVVVSITSEVGTALFLQL
jgi:hypothetical protein